MSSTAARSRRPSPHAHLPLSCCHRCLVVATLLFSTALAIRRTLSRCFARGVASLMMTAMSAAALLVRAKSAGLRRRTAQGCCRGSVVAAAPGSRRLRQQVTSEQHHDRTRLRASGSSLSARRTGKPDVPSECISSDVIHQRATMPASNASAAARRPTCRRRRPVPPQNRQGRISRSKRARGIQKEIGCARTLRRWRSGTAARATSSI